MSRGIGNFIERVLVFDFCAAGLGGIVFLCVRGVGALLNWK
jgi:hypothetical protein